MNLNFDPAPILTALDGFKTEADAFGLRPKSAKADLIVGLSRAYVEFAAMIRAFASSQGDSRAYVYDDPFPVPVLDPSVDTLGLPLGQTSAVFVLNLRDARLEDQIGEFPYLAIRVDPKLATLTEAAPHADDLLIRPSA